MPARLPPDDLADKGAAAIAASRAAQETAKEVCGISRAVRAYARKVVEQNRELDRRHAAG